MHVNADPVLPSGRPVALDLLLRAVAVALAVGLILVLLPAIAEAAS
jgi:hypothetical protein